MNIDLLMANTRSCTGSCVYCSAANQKDAYRNTILDTVAAKTYDEVLFDFDKLERTLKSYIGNKKEVRYTIWGADPLSCFLALQDTIDFLDWFNNFYNIKHIYCTSTNGLPIADDNIVDYINKNNIKLQLSHDGVAEELRLPIDPLVEFQDNFKRLKYYFINCVAHSYNTDFAANIEYFNKWAIPSTKNIRFSKPMLGANWSNAINRSGFKNGKHYEELKGTVFGDFGIHENIDEYIHDAMNLPEPYRFNVKYTNLVDMKLNSCGKFATGISKTSPHIDTLGNYTICNLVDSLGQLGNPNMKPQFSECNECRWKDSPICTGCCINPTEDTIHEKCVFNKKLNEAIYTNRLGNSVE